MYIAASPMSTVKLNLEHNLCSNKIPEVRFDLGQTILSVKEQVEKRYGSKVNYVRLTLKNKNGDKVAQMQEDFRSLGFYGAQEGYIILVTDLNPNSIHKEIQDFSKVQKYKISEEDYKNLPQNFRKWKKMHHPKAEQGFDPASLDLQYQKDQADQVTVGMRCRTAAGHRGTVSYVGKVPDMGVGYFVGLTLDEPFGTSNGKLLGVSYFQCQEGFGLFLRPSEIETGDFPVLSLDDQI